MNSYLFLAARRLTSPLEINSANSARETPLNIMKNAGVNEDCTFSLKGTFNGVTNAIDSLKEANSQGWMTSPVSTEKTDMQQ
jgi:hypothetical protein